MDRTVVTRGQLTPEDEPPCPPGMALEVGAELQRGGGSWAD